MERNYEEEYKRLETEFEALRQEAEVKLAVAFRKITEQTDHIYNLEVGLETLQRRLEDAMGGRVDDVDASHDSVEGE